jgi:glutaredoxin
MIVTLYSKPGCHLCEYARELLDELARELAFAVREVNIANEAALFERYRYRIPVLVVDGREIAEGRLSARDLRAAIEKGVSFFEGDSEQKKGSDPFFTSR